MPPTRGTDQIAVKIQHKDRLLTDPGAIEDVLAVENDVVPFDRADVPQRPRGDDLIRNKAPVVRILRHLKISARSVLVRAESNWL